MKNKPVSNVKCHVQGPQVTGIKCRVSGEEDDCPLRAMGCGALGILLAVPVVLLILMLVNALMEIGG